MCSFGVSLDFVCRNFDVNMCSRQNKRAVSDTCDVITISVEQLTLRVSIRYDTTCTTCELNARIFANRLEIILIEYNVVLKDSLYL